MTRGIGISAVRQYIASGGVGTVEEIALELGIKTSTTYWSLRTLRAHREADHVGMRESTGPTSYYVWGAWHGEQEPDVVSVALRNRALLEVVWQGIVHT